MLGLRGFVRTPGARMFLLVWAGQVVSLVGSGLTQFALGVWVFTVTGSPVQFALSVLCLAMPRIVFAPLAGPLIDRHDLRGMLIASDLAAALVTLALLLLASTGALALWHVYLAITLSAIASTVQRPAFTASISVLLPPEHYARAGGLVGLGPSLAAIIAPALAGLLYVRAGLPGVLLLDLASFLVAILALWRLRFPTREPDARHENDESLLRAALAGWRWLRAQPGLFRLLLVVSAANMLGITAEVLLTPYVLSFGSADLLGWLLAIGGAGLLAGSLLLSAWGGPRRLLRGVFGWEVVVCLTTILLGLSTGPWLLAAGVGVYFLAIALADGCETALWQRSVPIGLQGRIFALREAVTVAALPLGLLLTMPLAELVLEPRLQPGGAWAEGIGRLIGVGPGRGMALILVAAGLINLAVLAVGWASRPIRALDVASTASGTEQARARWS